MSMQAEIALAIVGIVGILSFAAGVTFFAFVWYPRMQKRARERQYPLVTSIGLRVAKIPVSGITLDDINRALKMFIDRAVEKGYDRSKLTSEIKRTYMRLVRAVNETDERYIVDEYGRKIAGDNNGSELRIVVLDDDTWEKTAGFHELGHTAHETKGKVDYGHRDDIMWHEIVGWCKKEFAA